MRSVRIRRTKQEKSPSALYDRVWRVIDGSVRDAAIHHPEYFAPGKQHSAIRSIVKRAVGAVTGLVEQSTEGRVRNSADSAQSLLTRRERGSGVQTSRS